jgi:hypothetical protein
MIFSCCFYQKYLCRLETNIFAVLGLLDIVTVQYCSLGEVRLIAR